MSVFRCRMVKPKASDWEKVEASSWGEAANEFHFRNTSGGRRLESYLFAPDPNAPGAWAHFALVEIEGHGETVSRVFTSGIRRKGGGRPIGPTLDQIARELGWTHDPKELINEDEGWDGGESEADALTRTRQEKLLFKLVDKDNKEHPVMLWGTYGVVCPSAGIGDNGSCREMARRVFERLNDKPFPSGWPLVVSESIFPDEAFVSEEALFEALKTEYQKVRRV